MRPCRPTPPEITALRREGLIRGCQSMRPSDFSRSDFPWLEQMRQNLNDLGRCHADWCVTAAAKPADAES